MKQKENMKKIYVMLIMVGGLSAQNSILKQFSDQFADIAEKAQSRTQPQEFSTCCLRPWGPKIPYQTVLYVFSLAGERCKT